MDGTVSVAAAQPWHPGELAIQRRAGVEEQMAAVGPRAIRDHLIEQHRAFYPMLPFIVVGAVDLEGNAWATMLAGRPGFLNSPDPKTLRVTGRAEVSDPAAAGLDDGDAVGLLGIELETRRRNRLNGTIRRKDAAGFDIAVEHSFGNCAKYFTRRQHWFAGNPTALADGDAQTSDVLDDRAGRMIRNADTLFVASYLDWQDGRRQVDVSHRGGQAGFVGVGEDGVLTIPDCAGNRFFNTLGNILENPKCGLMFIDFETGDLLHLTGDGEVVFDATELAGFRGAERLLRVRTRKAVFRQGSLSLRFASAPL
jgi:uncharacterized protein